MNCNNILKTATQNFERLTTLLKHLCPHGVGYTEYYYGTLRVTYKSTLGSFQASRGGGYEGGGVSVRSDIQACFGRCTIKAKYDSFSSEIENKIK